MSSLSRHIEHRGCPCVRCTLVNCGALDADWPEWREITFAGDARVIMTLLTRAEPPIWPGPRQRWAGTPDWFTAMGLGLEFGEEGRDGLPA
jgi:hypothetical protein